MWGFVDCSSGSPGAFQVGNVWVCEACGVGACVLSPHSPLGGLRPGAQL